MRRTPTYAETKLWKALRTTDLHFRRQAPFGPYIVDFVCHALRLIIEVDGGVHRLEAVAVRDAERETWLVGRGYRVVRVSSRAAEADPYAVVEKILSDFGAHTPTPDPSPQGGGGNSE